MDTVPIHEDLGKPKFRHPQFGNPQARVRLVQLRFKPLVLRTRPKPPAVAPSNFVLDAVRP